jgi:hypothetical protein
VTVPTDLAERSAVNSEQRAITRADPEQAAGALQHILATGDLAQLTNEQRVGYYLDLCRSLGLNPRSRPFDWLLLDNRLILYPNKSCAEQIRAAHQISVKVLRREPVGELFVVEVEGRTPDGRTDVSSKYVPLTKWDRQAGRHVRLNSGDLANAYAKAETGAKRRLAFSMVGLAALPDPDEIKGGRVVVVDGSGHVIERPTENQRALAADPSLATAIGEPTYEDSDAASSPLAGEMSQAPTPEQLEPVKRTIPRQSFRPSDEDVKRWQGAFFAAVKGTTLDTDDARHGLVADWTIDKGWPKAKLTDSLVTMLRRSTAAEAEDFLAYVRGLADDERAAAREALAAHNAGEAATEADVEPF